jgi:hypothetical protein
VISNKQAFDRLTLAGGSVDPLLRKALLHLGERLSALESGVPPASPEPVAETITEDVPDEETLKGYAGLSFAELRAECKAQGLPAGGTRDDLIGRLESA